MKQAWLPPIPATPAHPTVYTRPPPLIAPVVSDVVSHMKFSSRSLVNEFPKDQSSRTNQPNGLWLWGSSLRLLTIPRSCQRRKKPQHPHMPMTVTQVVEETSRWPADQVEVLFEKLLDSHYRLPDPALDPEWAEELKRRIDDIESGREAGIPGEEVMARMRKIVGL